MVAALLRYDRSCSTRGCFFALDSRVLLALCRRNALPSVTVGVGVHAGQAARGVGVLYVRRRSEGNCDGGCSGSDGRRI